jgi:hypothetical protein
MMFADLVFGGILAMCVIAGGIIADKNNLI